MRIINIKTGKLIHEFEKLFKSGITILEQSPAIDIVAVGLKNGQIILHNIKLDETLQMYMQDASVTSIAFRFFFLCIFIILIFRSACCCEFFFFYRNKFVLIPLLIGW